MWPRRNSVIPCYPMALRKSRVPITSPAPRGGAHAHARCPPGEPAQQAQGFSLVRKDSSTIFRNGAICSPPGTIGLRSSGICSARSRRNTFHGETSCRSRPFHRIAESIRTLRGSCRARWRWAEGKSCCQRSIRIQRKRIASSDLYGHDLDRGGAHWLRPSWLFFGLYTIACRDGDR